MTKFELAIENIKGATYSTEFYNKIYLVGGCIRDELLNIPIKDIDIMVDMPDGGVKLAEYLLSSLPDNFSNLVIYERFGTAKITFMSGHDNECEIEFVAPRTEIYDASSRKPIKVEYCDLKTDALRRDFTVNALYKNIHTNEIIDPTNDGISSLNALLLNTPTDPEITFYDDPLRMLRAIRFECQKGFYMHPKTFKAIKKNSYRLAVDDNATGKPISMERINDEFTKIIMSLRAVDGIIKLYHLDCFKHMLKDQHINRMFGFDQRNIHHNETLDAHVLSVLNRVIMNNPNASLELRLAAFLHDIGKLDCYQLKSDGIHYSYHGHEIVSGKIAYDILKELKYSNDVCDKVKFIIEHHMLLKQFNDGNGHLKISDKSARKILRKCEDYIDEILELMDADNKSHADEASNRLWHQIDDFRELIPSLYINYSTCKNMIIKCPLNGHDIMKEFNIQPGPKVKEILEIAIDIFDENPSYSKDDIIKTLKTKVNN